MEKGYFEVIIMIGNRKGNTWGMIGKALIIGIGFLAFGLLGLLVTTLLVRGFCVSVCTFPYESLLVRLAIRIYGLISMGIGSLFVLIGAFGNSLQHS